MVKTVTARIMGDDFIKVSKEKTLLEISKDYGHLFQNDILLAKIDNEVTELHRSLSDHCLVEFLDITNPHGFKAYQRSLVMLMVCVVKELLGKKTCVVVEHSINKNYYCEINKRGLLLNDRLLAQVEARMHEMVEQNIPIEKISVPVVDAVRIFSDFGMMDKVGNMRYRRTANVNLYRLNGFCDYFYGPMVNNVGYLKKFGLSKRDKGFIIQFPSTSNPEEMSELKPLKKMSQVFQEANNWSKILKVTTIGEMNDKICSGDFNQVIRISEALHEKKIAYIADEINKGRRRIVLVAGPSSSGKTTFSERLCIQMRVNGLYPYLVSLDHYFFNRVDAPLGPDGRPDFENFTFMDVEQLNQDLTNLLNGSEVEIPYYNFHTGMREYRGSRMKLERGDVLLLEGIHALNEALTYSVPGSKKFKIFISALTQLNMDNHNRIPTSDTRLLRRIVRDHHFRGTDAATTIAQWPSVMRGADAHVFPYQEQADAFFNSALIYEMSVLKQYAEPLLFRIDKSCPEYADARRLIKFLDGFVAGSDKNVNPNSILREFIGGSCFET